MERRPGQNHEDRSRLSFMPSSKWVKGKHRNSAGHELVLSMDAGLKARGWERTDRKAVINVAVELKKQNPAYETETSLQRAYYHAASFPPPLSVLEDRLMSLLQKWGVPPEEARGLVTRALAVATAAQKPFYVGQLFDWIARRGWDRGRKANRVRSAVDEMEANRWPLMQGSDRTGEMIKAALNKPGSVAEVAAATKLNPITVQNYLSNMADNGEIKHVGFGRYASLAEGLSCYVRPGKLVWNVLVSGPATPAQIRAHTGLSEAQVAAALHWLSKRKKIERTYYGEWAAAGTATPHVFAKDAILKALQFGSKTVRELEKHTGKNRGELWAALRGLKDREEVVEAYLIYPGRRGYRAAFALPPASTGRHA